MRNTLCITRKVLLSKFQFRSKEFVGTLTLFQHLGAGNLGRINKFGIETPSVACFGAQCFKLQVCRIIVKLVLCIKYAYYIYDIKHTTILYIAAGQLPTAA